MWKMMMLKVFSITLPSFIFPKITVIWHVSDDTINFGTRKYDSFYINSSALNNCFSHSLVYLYIFEFSMIFFFNVVYDILRIQYTGSICLYILWCTILDIYHVSVNKIAWSKLHEIFSFLIFFSCFWNIYGMPDCTLFDRIQGLLVDMNIFWSNLKTKQNKTKQNKNKTSKQKQKQNKTKTKTKQKRTKNVEFAL